jgi:anti-sigma regulatory factor (Ser/Thr protein kinase)
VSRLPFAAQTPVPEKFRHEAFLYSGEAHFVAGAAAFVHSGLDAGETVLVAVIEPRATLLRRALGRAAERVEFLDMANVGRNPARIIPAWQDWIDRNVSTAKGFRGIGEPIWADRTASEVTECQQYEQLLNTAFDGGPAWWLLCPYDTGVLPEQVIGRAHDTHPAVVAGDGRKRSESYPHPQLSFSAMFGEPLEEPPEPVFRFGFGLANLGELRDHVARYAEHSVGERAVADAVLVVAELAANSIKYGGGAGALRMWCDGSALVCEVRDDGVITDPLIGRRRPSANVRGKAGLWIVNQVCDLLQIRSGLGRGTVVRARLGSAASRN